MTTQLLKGGQSDIACRHRLCAVKEVQTRKMLERNDALGTEHPKHRTQISNSMSGGRDKKAHFFFQSPYPL